MSKLRFLLFSSLSIFIFALVWNALVHLVILKQDNIALQTIHRSDIADKMWISIIVTYLIAILFSISFSKWNTKPFKNNNYLHSLLFAVIMIVVVDINQYVQYAIPFITILKWAFFGIFEFLIYGIIASFIYEKTHKNEPNYKF